MIEIFGDLWSHAPEFDAVCITTNGTVKGNGEAVMGRGVARQAASKWSDLPKDLGTALKQHGNQIYLLKMVRLPGHQHLTRLLSFPVKHEWFQEASLVLIETSTRDLVAMLDAQEELASCETVLLPRPGCGNGKLRWVQVRPVIEPFLDSRFSIITRKPSDR